MNVLRGDFSRLQKWFNNKDFKFVISASHCQQLGLYSKCYTVCDLHLSHCRLILPVIRLPLEDNSNRTFFIFSLLNLNILHTKRCFFKKALKSYILMDFVFLIIFFLKIAFSSLGFYRLLQQQCQDVGFWGGMASLSIRHWVRFFKINSDSVQIEFGSLRLKKIAVRFGYHSYLLLM